MPCIASAQARTFATASCSIRPSRWTQRSTSLGPACRLGTTLPIFHGRQAIGDAIFDTIATLDTTHTITNPRVTAYDGQRATLFALVEAQHLPRDEHSRHLLLKNIYTVALSRHGDRWIIDRMHIENVWMTGDPSVLFAVARA
jgi:hypothetical protein